MTKEEVEVGTIRIRSRDLVPIEKTRLSWKKSSADLSSAILVIKLFRSNNNMDVLIDRKNPRFVKGQLSSQGKVQGARIDLLPSGEQVDKPYSLFAPHLQVHDESTQDHWDVIYQNPNGQYAYVYTKAKLAEKKKSKYLKVEKFKKHHLKLNREVHKALSDYTDHIALPMFTLLKTYMRIGNEIYFRTHGHKGLTTLQKKDIKIHHNNQVTFTFLAKDGVPMSITETFPDEYIQRLKSLLNELKRDSFLFTTPKTGHTLNDVHFKHAFFKYCGEEFYPHIVRSYFATNKAQKFLASKKEPTKQEARELCLAIAHKLGHRKYDKKEHEWKENYTVTLNNYIQPELASQIKKIIKGK